MRCFIVDDSQSYIDIIKTVISDFCSAIGSTTEAANAIEKIIEFDPDVIVVDWLMPDKSGLDLATEIAENDRINHIPVIMVSGSSMVLKTFKHLKIDEFISKTESISNIRSTLKIFSNIGRINKAARQIDVNSKK